MEGFQLLFGIIPVVVILLYIFFSSFRILREYEIHPEDFGLTMASNRALKVETPEQSKALLMAVLENEPGPARDIVMVGEVRDLETADIAIKAALTGHLVFSSLHTNSAPESIVRLLDMAVDADAERAEEVVDRKTPIPALIGRSARR